MPRVGLTRAAVVAAAGEIADADGLDALDLTRLSDRFGVKKPSLYKHIEGLPEIRDALALEGLAALTALLGPPLRTRAELTALALAWADYARAHPGRYRALSTLPADRPPEVGAAAAALLALLLARLGGLGLSPEDAVHTARGIRALIDGFVAIEREGGFGLPIAPRASFERALSALVSAFIPG